MKDFARALIISAAFLLLAACTPVAEVPHSLTPTVTPVSTSTATPTEVPTPSPTPTPPPTPEPTPSDIPDYIREIPGSCITQSFFTDGIHTVVPNMRYLDISEELRETLTLLDDTQKLEGEPDCDIIQVNVYGNDDLEIRTMSYDPQKMERSDPKRPYAGVEYVFSVTAKSDVFYNYRYIKLGDPATVWQLLHENSTYRSLGYPSMHITIENGVVTKMESSTVPDIIYMNSYVPTEEELVCLERQNTFD